MHDDLFQVRCGGSILIGLLVAAAGCATSNDVPRSPDEVEHYRPSTERSGPRDSDTSDASTATTSASRSSEGQTDPSTARSSPFSATNTDENTTTSSSSDTGPASSDITSKLDQVPEQNYRSLEDVEWPDKFDRQVRNRFRQHLQRRGWIDESDEKQGTTDEEPDKSTDRTGN